MATQRRYRNNATTTPVTVLQLSFRQDLANRPPETACLPALDQLLRTIVRDLRECMVVRWTALQSESSAGSDTVIVVIGWYPTIRYGNRPAIPLDCIGSDLQSPPQVYDFDFPITWLLDTQPADLPDTQPEYVARLSPPGHDLFKLEIRPHVLRWSKCINGKWEEKNHDAMIDARKQREDKEWENKRALGLLGKQPNPYAPPPPPPVSTSKTSGLLQQIRNHEKPSSPRPPPTTSARGPPPPSSRQATLMASIRSECEPQTTSPRSALLSSIKSGTALRPMKLNGLPGAFENATPWSLTEPQAAKPFLPIAFAEGSTADAGVRDLERREWDTWMAITPLRAEDRGKSLRVMPPSLDGWMALCGAWHDFAVPERVAAKGPKVNTERLSGVLKKIGAKQLEANASEADQEWDFCS